MGLPCMQEVYRELLISEDKMQKRFTKVLEKLEQEKAASIVGTCSCCMLLATHAHVLFLRFWEAPCDYSFVDLPEDGKFVAEIARALFRLLCDRTMVSFHIFELAQAEGEAGANNFDFLMTFYASFAQRLPTYREMQACLLLQRSVGSGYAITDSMPDC